MSALPTTPPNHPGGDAGLQDQRALPPVTAISIATLSLIVIGGIYLAANMTGKIDLTLPTVLLALAAVLLLANIALILRINPFARRRFFQVSKWLLLAYVVIAGMLEYVFIYDGVRGGTLAVLSGSLVIFGVNAPLIVAYTVARYEHPD
jgi:cytochrome bd-type quinol oxidase subunit 2